VVYADAEYKEPEKISGRLIFSTGMKIKPERHRPGPMY